MDRTTTPVTRRRLLGCGALIAAGSVAGCSGDGGDGERSADDAAGTDEAAYGGFLSDVPNDDGTPADRTDSDTVMVAVGAGNGLRFDPPAVRVSPGTTVVWEWTGEGGQHNVSAVDGSFESELATAAGTTFERTFEAVGPVRYVCVPHQSLGMKGVVDVVED